MVAPHGPVPFLICAQGALVGETARSCQYFYSVPIDAELSAKPHGAEPMGPLGHVIAVNEAVWAFPSGKNEAHLIRIR